MGKYDWWRVPGIILYYKQVNNGIVLTHALLDCVQAKKRGVLLLVGYNHYGKLLFMAPLHWGYPRGTTYMLHKLEVILCHKIRRFELDQQEWNRYADSWWHNIRRFESDQWESTKSEVRNQVMLCYKKESPRAIFQFILEDLTEVRLIL